MEIKAYPDFSKKSTSSDAIPLLFKVTAGARNHTFVLATGFRTEEDAKNWIKQNWK